MRNGSFSWLHLTDLHYGLKGQDCLWPTLREPFLDSLSDLHKRCGPWDAVVFTGDLVQSGETAQFQAMQEQVLKPLWVRLCELQSSQIALLAVPGNHDLYRPNPMEDNPAVDTLLDPDGYQRVEGKFWDQSTGGYRRVIDGAFASYSQWWEQAPHRPPGIRVGALPGDYSVTLEAGDRQVGVIGLNTSFLQLAGGDYEGHLVWDARQVQAVCGEGVDVWSNSHDIAILLTHHGPRWLTPQAQQHGGSEIAPPGRFAVHLFGHQHEPEITYLQFGGSPHAVHRCQGCSVFGMERFGEPPRIRRVHGYSAGRIDFSGTGAHLRLWPRLATSATGRWRFIPDHEHAELRKDEGTSPVSVVTRPRNSKRSRRVNGEHSVGFHRAPGIRSMLLPRRPFFGRKEELEKVAKYLRPENRSWGVVLDGPGGVGKTALALEAAHRAPVEHFPLKLWFTAKVSELLPEGERKLEAARVESFYALLSEIGRALSRDDIPKAVPEMQPQLVRHALADYRALLVLDNLESFNKREQARTFELLETLPPGCRAIVTSRYSAYASTAAHLRLDRLEHEAADLLLIELGRRWKPVANLSKIDRDRLYAETGGNPLLLTWVAGQLGRITGRCRTVSEAVSRLQEAHRREKQDVKNDPLDFAFRDLAETFSAEEAAVLSALVYFDRPAPVDWLIPLTRLSPTAVDTALDGLRDRALLIEDEQARTWLLPPMAARFLRRTCPRTVEISGQRLAEQVHQLATMNGYRQFSRFPMLEESWPKIAAALPVLISGDNRRLQETCDALYRFLDSSGRWDIRLALSEAAETSAERAEDFMNAGRRAYDIGYGHYLRGQSAEVLTCANRAARHWGKTPDAGAHEHALAIFLRGQGCRLGRDYPGAIIALQEALDLWRGIKSDSFPVASCFNALAEVLRESNRLEEAENYYRNALAIASHLPEPESVATYTGNIAELALDRGEWSEAERLAREALRLAEDVGRKELIADDCWRLAKALVRQGHSEEGRPFAERAVACLTELRSPGLAEAKVVLAEFSGAK